MAAAADDGHLEVMVPDGAWPCGPASASYGPPGPGGQWMNGGGMDHMLPFWREEGESSEHVDIMLGIHTTCCPDFRRGFCTKGKGKAGHCFCYHFESQARRPPIAANDGRLHYWDVQCPNYNSEMGYCPSGEMCTFAHGRNEVSYHPAKYKTRLCNGTECRGEAVCCFAHSDQDLRLWANERYSYLSIVSLGGSSSAAANNGGPGEAGGPNAGASSSLAGPFHAPVQQKHRFCASYPNVSQCRRGAACAFAHSREEACTPLLTVEEEEHEPNAMTHIFFTEKFKTLWCPIGAQHDWQNCPYAHTYQDARRKPNIGYGPQPCPYWSKKDTRVAYSQRCPLGLRCPYSHGAKEQLYHPKYFRTVICRDLQLKGCPRQTLCAFFHRRQERRTAEVDDVDYMQPLDKENISGEWSSYFLSPPFFQEAANEGGASGSSGMGPQGMGHSGPGMGMPSGKGHKGQQHYGHPGGMGPAMGMPHMGGGMKGGHGGMAPGPVGPGSTWYAGYLAGMANLQQNPGRGSGRPPKTRAADGGSRTPTSGESDGGLEETEEVDAYGMPMGGDAMGGWGHPGFPPGAGQPVWGGMPAFYSDPGGFVPAPYGAPAGYPGFYRGPMGHPADMQEDAWWGPGQ